MITFTKKSCIVSLVAICLLNYAYAFNTTIPQQQHENENDGESSVGNDKRDTGSNSIKSEGSSSIQQQTDYYTHYYSNKQEILNTKYDDASTYLDLFGERAKTLLTQHIIPSTDAECKWDWRMGRCEPYCKCSFNFLAGDYHLGRSCRYRMNFPQDDEFISDVTNEEAWQQVRETQEGSVDSSSTIYHPTCKLPPESRYIQIIKQLNKLDYAIEQAKRVKRVGSHALEVGLVHGQRVMKNTRQKACETVKNKIEERAKVRDQPVILTRQGSKALGLVCGTSDSNKRRNDEETTDQQTDSADDSDDERHELKWE